MIPCRKSNFFTQQKMTSEKIQQLEQHINSLPEEKRQLAQQIVKAESSRKRVSLMATVMDRFGVDGLIGTVFPAVGDGVTSLVAGIYILAEAKRVDLDQEQILKIVAYQSGDFAIGAIPILGDAIDTFVSHPNIKSSKMFAKNLKELEANAIDDGVDPDLVKKIVKAAGKLEKSGEIFTETDGHEEIHSAPEKELDISEG